MQQPKALEIYFVLSYTCSYSLYVVSINEAEGSKLKWSKIILDPNAFIKGKLH